MLTYEARLSAAAFCNLAECPRIQLNERALERAGADAPGLESYSRSLVISTRGLRPDANTIPVPIFPHKTEVLRG